MSASYKDRDGMIYFPHILNDFEQAMFASQFDIQCEWDIQDIYQNSKELVLFKKVCFYKLLLFIPEFILTVIMFGKESSIYKLKETKLYWKFFRKKIDIETFKKDLTELVNSGKII